MLEEEKKMTRTGDTTSNKAPPQTGEIKGPSHPKKGTRKGRNGKDLTETEALQKRRQKYTQKRNYTKKVLMTQITTMGCLLTWSQTLWGVTSSGP